MDTLLRKYAEWKGKRKAAQIIVFDGGAEVERTRFFLRGAVVGIGVSFGLFALTAPTTADPRLMEEARHREELLAESHQRLEQAVMVANVCVNTAQELERTLNSYQQFLGGKQAP